MTKKVNDIHTIKKLHRSAINKKIGKTCLELEELGVIKIVITKDNIIKIQRTKFGQDVFNYMKKKGMI